MKRLLTPLASLTVLFVASSAWAEPFTAGKPQIGAGLEYGVYTGDDGGADDPLNPYGLGINARGGYTLGMGLYVGLGLDYFLGESEESTVFGQTLEVSANIFQLGAEVGYDVGIGEELVLRPKLGLGYASMNAEFTAGGETTDNSESGLAITPGVQGLYSLGSLFLSLDARLNILEIESETDVVDPFTGTTTTVTSDADVGGFIIGAGVGMAF